MKEITTKELTKMRQQNPDINIIDVREDDEVAQGMIPGAKHIPMGEIPKHLEEIDKENTQYIVCRSGGRSRRIGEYMVEQGYDAINVDGGMLDWEEDTEKRISSNA